MYIQTYIIRERPCFLSKHFFRQRCYYVVSKEESSFFYTSELIVVVSLPVINRIVLNYIA